MKGDLQMLYSEFTTRTSKLEHSLNLFRGLAEHTDNLNRRWTILFDYVLPASDLYCKMHQDFRRAIDEKRVIWK